NELTVLELLADFFPNPAQIAEAACGFGAVGEVGLHVTLGFGIEAGIGFAPSREHAVGGIAGRKSFGFFAEAEEEFGHAVDAAALAKQDLRSAAVIYVLRDDG